MPSLRLFRACYRLKADGWTTPRFERVALPAAGGMEDQPALVLEQLDLIETVTNDLLAQLTAEHRKRKPSDERSG